MSILLVQVFILVMLSRNRLKICILVLQIKLAVTIPVVDLLGDEKQQRLQEEERVNITREILQILIGFNEK